VSEKQVEAKSTKKKKKLTVEEKRIFYRERIRDLINSLAKIEPEKQEELAFVLTIFHSLFSGKNPNLYQKFLKRLD
jgi:CRISPR/Cas system-associated endonuclease Cas3-HD